jgi:hypothetical protein
LTLTFKGKSLFSVCFFNELFKNRHFFQQNTNRNGYNNPHNILNHVSRNGSQWYNPITK